MGSDAAEVFGMRNRCGRVGRHCVGRKQHRPSFTALSCHATAATSVPSGVEFDKEKYRKPPFPFVLISGQDAMKRSLLINAVDPAVGGVILLGDRGTGKSIAVKAMADIMPVGIRRKSSILVVIWKTLRHHRLFCDANNIKLAIASLVV